MEKKERIHRWIIQITRETQERRQRQERHGGPNEEINKQKLTRRSDYQIIILYSFYYILLIHSLAAFGYGTRRHTNCVRVSFK